MKVNLTVQEILIWHDEPQLFVANDSVDGVHLCIKTSGETPHFLVVAISPNRLRAVKTGQIDLHTAFANPELNTWFEIKNYDSTTLTAEQMPEFSKPSANWLPNPNAFLTSQPSEAPVLLPESFAAIKVGAVAKEAGMNVALLRQYVSGVKHPSREQALKVQDALHRVAQRLLDVRLV
jgi:hypothetical protein